jgi:chemotaxis signal transduction protein
MNGIGKAGDKLVTLLNIDRMLSDEALQGVAVAAA